MQLSSSEV
jgi:hypothetical protein